MKPSKMLQTKRACLVLAHLNTPSPGSLNLCRTLHQELQACKLDALEGRQLEEHQRLSHRPRQAVVGLRHMKLSREMFQELLGTGLGVINVLQASKEIKRVSLRVF